MSDNIDREDFISRLESEASELVERKLCNREHEIEGSRFAGESGDKYVVHVEHGDSPLSHVSRRVETDYGVAEIDFVFDNSVGVVFDKEISKGFYKSRGV